MYLMSILPTTVFSRLSGFLLAIMVSALTSSYLVISDMACHLSSRLSNNVTLPEKTTVA